MTTLVGARCILKVQLTTIRVALALHLPTQLTTIEVGPGVGTFFSSFYSLPYPSFSSGRPARWNPK